MAISLRILWNFTLVVLASVLNFILWYYIAKTRSQTDCHTSFSTPIRPTLCRPTHLQRTATKSTSSCDQTLQSLSSSFSLLMTSGFVKYKEDFLLNIPYSPWSILMTNSGDSRTCSRIVHPYVASRRKYSCLAVVKAQIDNTLNLLRHEEIDVKTKNNDDPDASEEAKKTNSSGFFGNVGNENSRNLFKKKLMPLASGLSDLENFVRTRLAERGLLPGQDLVVMVLNPGEIDIFANLICSCWKRNISTANFVVFSSSQEIVPLIHALGVLALFHEETFAHSPVRANSEYLDPTFIDMMWYKSFSVWLLLRLGYPVLFQDVDLVWFRDPFPFFRALSLRLETQGKGRPDALLSDDGQRSLRYAPFYANSGFYYFRSTRRMVWYAWAVLTAFPVLHITGSHQNVFTLRLLEGMDLARIRTAFLPMSDFPSGVKFSHDRSFMRRILLGLQRPYVFHMCWTLNKYHKLRNFREARMWFLRPDVSAYLDELGNGNFSAPSGGEARERRRRGQREQLQLRPSGLLQNSIYLEERNISLERRWQTVRPYVCQ